jgi:hypothetical protein
MEKSRKAGRGKAMCGRDDKTVGFAFTVATKPRPSSALIAARLASSKIGTVMPVDPLLCVGTGSVVTFHVLV